MKGRGCGSVKDPFTHITGALLRHHECDCMLGPVFRRSLKPRVIKSRDSSSFSFTAWWVALDSGKRSVNGTEARA